MKTETGVFLIIGACLLVLFLLFTKQKAELILNFCIRSIMGMMTIYGINLVLGNFGVPCLVGLNLWSLLTSGLLGVSGVSLLYAISALQFLHFWHEKVLVFNDFLCFIKICPEFFDVFVKNCEQIVNNTILKVNLRLNHNK